MKEWKLTIHALSRGASRVGLLIDVGTEMEIRKAMNETGVLITSQRHRGCAIYEFHFKGRRLMAVVDPANGWVITFLDPKRWYRDVQGGGQRRRGQADESDDWQEEVRKYEREV